MSRQNPERLSDVRDAGLAGELLIAAQRDGLSQQSQDKVWQALTAATGAAAAVSAKATVAGAKSGAGLAWLKAPHGILGLGLLGVVGVGAVIWSSSHPSQVSHTAQRALTTPVWSDGSSREPEAQPAVAATDLPKVEAQPPASARSVQPSATAKGSAAQSVSAPSEVSPHEGLLLLRARQVLESNPAQALALARQHEREFPNSQLAIERATLLKEAQERLQR